MIHEKQEFAAVSVQTPRVRGGLPSALIAAALSLAGTLATLPADAATPALFLEQSSITGASDTVKAARVPVSNSAGAIKYYDIEVKFELNSSGVPILAAFSPQIGLSPTLTVGTFKAGNYKDGYGNVYNVTGPGAASGGRTNWAILLTKTGSTCSSCSLSGSWTTGAITGHPLETILKEQGITSTAYSWGMVTTNISGTYGGLRSCSSNDAVGVAQVGNQLILNGYCSHTANQTDMVTLNLCTTANPC